MEKFIYSLLFQKVNAEDEKDEIKFFSELHASLLNEFQSEISVFNKTRTEAVQKAVSGLRGGLSTYLSTPLMSDKDDIERVIRDNVENMVSQLKIEENETASRLFSYKILEAPQIPLQRQLVGVMRRLIKNGKTMLADAGISTGKNSGNLYLMLFTLDEFATLPVLKARIDSVMTRSSTMQFTVVNDCISNILVVLESDSKMRGHTVLINFDGNDLLADKLNVKLATLLNQFGAKNIKLSRRTFYTGFGTAFQMQFVVDLNKQALGSIIMSLVEDDEELEDALTTQGSLIVLEKVA